MGVQHIVMGFLGFFFIFVGSRMLKNKDWKKNDIEKWRQYPQTTARITTTVTNRSSDGTANGVRYRAELLIDEQWRRGESVDSFSGGRLCQNGEEVVVAYRPFRHSKVADTIMTAMVKAAFEEDWNDRKPEFQFKIMNETKYANEGKRTGEYWFFIIFGCLVLFIDLLSMLGIIE